jgi:hypothetical protein
MAALCSFIAPCLFFYGVVVVAILIVVVFVVILIIVFVILKIAVLIVVLKIVVLVIAIVVSVVLVVHYIHFLSSDIIIYIFFKKYTVLNKKYKSFINIKTSRRPEARFEHSMFVRQPKTRS